MAIDNNEPDSSWQNSEDQSLAVLQMRRVSVLFSKIMEGLLELKNSNLKKYTECYEAICLHTPQDNWPQELNGIVEKAEKNYKDEMAIIDRRYFIFQATADALSFSGYVAMNYFVEPSRELAQAWVITPILDELQGNIGKILKNDVNALDQIDKIITDIKSKHQGDFGACWLPINMGILNSARLYPQMARNELRRQQRDTLSVPEETQKIMDFTTAILAKIAKTYTGEDISGNPREIEALTKRQSEYFINFIRMLDDTLEKHPNEGKAICETLLSAYSVASNNKRSFDRKFSDELKRTPIGKELLGHMLPNSAMATLQMGLVGLGAFTPLFLHEWFAEYPRASKNLLGELHHEISQKREEIRTILSNPANNLAPATINQAIEQFDNTLTTIEREKDQRAGFSLQYIAITALCLGIDMNLVAPNLVKMIDGKKYFDNSWRNNLVISSEDRSSPTSNLVTAALAAKRALYPKSRRELLEKLGYPNDQPQSSGHGRE